VRSFENLSVYGIGKSEIFHGNGKCCKTAEKELEIKIFKGSISSI
jgi:hypothetical protein